MVFGFPKAGEVYGSFDVVSSNFDANKGTWSVLFSDEIQKQYALQALKPFLGKVAVFEVDGIEHSVEFPTKETKIEYVRNNPPTSVQTLVHGRFFGDTAFQNPTTVEAFEEELGKMTVKKPTKWFRIHPITELHSPSFRNKLWSFVTRRGESYGWVVGKQIYHRKGSLIMPYVKINKHVENAKVMYHTHPSKDEPSFSSADDIQWYLDAAYKWGIRHYYTIMANRLDHFEITTKGDKGRNSYLRMDEGKFIDDLDTMLSKLEEQYKGDAISDEKFCEKVTRKWVAEMNERFGHIMNIKYHSHIKKETPLKNPGSGTPLGVAKRIGLDDRHISTALGELKGLDYDWIHYGGDEFAHTMYVYWWTKYHFLPKADGKDRLYTWEGLSKESRAKLREYLDTEIEAGWTRSDVLLMLGLYHDIAKRREKEDNRHHSVIGAEMFREEIAPEIGLSQNLTDHISLLLQSDVGRRGITEEEFQTIAGDLYLLCKIFHMADRTAHHPYMFTSAAATARQEGLLQAGQYGDAYIAVRNKQDIETIEHILQHNVIPNPPPKMPYNVQYGASYEIAIDPDTAEMLFEDYDPRKIVGNDGKFGSNFRMSYGQGIYIRMPLKDGYIATATLGFAYPAKLNILGIPSREDYGVSAASEVYSRVGQVLAQVYDVKSDELLEPSSDTTSDNETTESPEADVLPAANVSFPVQPMINPKHCKKDVRGVVQQPSQSTIVIAGPMGSGRREVAKELGRHGYQICPMHTTQPSPVGRVPNRDSVDHDKESFMQLVKADQMPYWTMDEKGHCYGYTKEQLQAPKTVMYTSPTMALRMKDSLPHLHIVYLQNNQSPQQHEMKLSSRSGITPRQAKAASKFAYHQKRKASQFDTVIPVDDDDYMNAAMVLNNSNFFPGEAVNKYPWLKSADLISQTVPISKLNPPIKVVRRDKTEDGTSHFYNADTDEDITGKSFDGATLDTNKDVYVVGDPTPIPKGRERFAGGLHYFNIAKWGDRKIIQYSRDSQGFDSIYVERVEIDGVVYLNSAPFNFREPSAHVMVRGRAEVDWESAKLVTGGEITDFDNNSKSHGEPDTVVKSVKIKPRERGPRYRVNPRIPKKYEGQDPSEHSDLYTDEDPRGTIQGLGFKDKETAERSVNIIKRSGKTHAHKIQAAMAMEQRARFHPNATSGIKAAQKVYANFIEEMKKKTKARRNPQFNIEGMQFFTTVPTMKHTNLGAVSAEIEVDRNIPKELVGNVKDIFLGLVEDYEKKTDKRTALAIAFAIDELTEETKRRGGNGVMNFTVETGGSLGLPIVEFNKTIPAVIIVTGDAIKLKKAKRNPSENLTPTATEIREALDIFGEQQGLDANKAMLIAGAALYMHGLKPIMNDVDAIIPGKPDISEGYVNGLELDIGGGPDFTAEMLDYEVKEGVRYHSLSAILAFYKMLNREKDQVWIEKLSKMLNKPRLKRNASYSIQSDFEAMINRAYLARTKEITGEDPTFNGRVWWNEQIPQIEERYGTEPLNYTWLHPIKDPDFDPSDKSKEFDENGDVLPIHFLNQLKRIPLTKQPTPERIMQIALNIGQGLASGSVERRYSFDEFLAANNPHHCPVETEARRAATDPSFKHHEWYIEHHLDYVKAIVHSLKPNAGTDEMEVFNDMVWMHDYPKMLGDKDNFELVRNLVSKHKGKAYADELVQYIDDMERIKSPDWNGQTTMYGAVMSTADALAHYYGPFWQIYMDENKDKDLDFLKKSNAAKLEKDKNKLRAGPKRDALDSVKFQYKGRKVRVVGNEHIAELIEKKNPPLTFEELIPVVFEISEDRQYTLFNRLIKLMEESGEIAEEVLIKEGFKPYKEPGKDGVEGEITDAIIVLLMAFERNGGTPDELKDLLYKSISKGGLKLKRNPSKTPEGRKIPKRYLKGLNKEEMLIAAKEIDKGYKYDINDPKAYEYWKSDIKATARGYKTVPSKYKRKFIQMYGPLPKGGKFLTKIAKATGIKKSILQKVYNKGLAAWRGGHRPGVQQHQWAAGRVYSFVTLGNTVKKGNKKMPDYQLAIDAGLIKANPRKGNKPTLEEFRQWVDQVNMKNKEIKAFMESDWFDVAGLTPEEAGEQGIFSGQDSLRRIIRMRKKLGLTGPKDYIKPGPQTTKRYYELALEKWTGLDSSVPIKEDTTDWGWMLRQNRFNGRAAAYPYNKAAEYRRGPLVKKQKTQNKPSRKLLSLWVWGHDPWRWARKNGIANMPKCADVPWVGMTEKRKYGKVPVLMSPTVKKNPELAIPPFGLAFVPQTEVKGILKEGIKAQDGVVPLIYPFPNWKGKILPALYEKVKETPMKDIALLKINHPLSQGMKADSDVAYYHKGSVKPSQIENIVKWWDSIDFESGQITDTKEYREWMDASGIELILTIKQNPIGRKVMYHGSSVPNINRLQQNYNHLVGREVVFATPNYEYALAMAIDSTNDDLEIGYINGQFMIAEVYEGAFELLKEPSYIYEIKANGFHQHPRLPEMEYIIEASMPVLKSKRVPNTYKELKRIGTTFIPYGSPELR